MVLKFVKCKKNNSIFYKFFFVFARFIKINWKKNNWKCIRYFELDARRAWTNGKYSLVECSARKSVNDARDRFAKQSSMRVCFLCEFLLRCRISERGCSSWKLWLWDFFLWMRPFFTQTFAMWKYFTNSIRGLLLIVMRFAQSNQNDAKSRYGVERNKNTYFRLREYKRFC